ncbi:MAG: DUF1801 domain-containing protein [Actinomycetota bacterium]|nr:DUF1801 domain-containing protein [Actinomycetota bacterium]
MQSKAETPARYVAELEPARRAEVEAVRGLIRQAAPAAEEAMEWGMLNYRVGGRALVALASQKRHLSLYLLETCTEPDVLEPYRAELAGLDMGKGCIRFKWAADLPSEALRGIIAAGAGTPRGPSGVTRPVG